MAKPTIVTRSGKGSALTWTEGDSNLTNLKDATVSIKAGSAGVSVSADLNSEIVLVSGSNITLTGDNTAKTITIAASQPTSVATLTTPRAIYGNNFDGSAALTQVIASTYGGTGNGFAKFTGPTTAEKTFTLPDASSTILVSGGALGTPSGGTVTNLTGTASININGTVGATTATTGAFTTLTATGAVTLSPASLAVAISPTGTGTVAISPAGALTINPTAASTINNTSIGATTASTGRFTTVTSTQATGTAPFTVASTTNVANLNASSLSGATFAAPGAIGSGTASSGAFTTVSATGVITSTQATGTAPFTVASTTQVANLNAATAGTATTATNATNVATTVASTNTSYYIPFVASNTASNQGLNTQANITYNPSTLTLNPANFQSNTAVISGYNSTFGTAGSGFRTTSSTFTDTATAAGTVAADYYHIFGAPTRASTNAITVTDLVNLFVGAPATSTNTTATNKYAVLTDGTIKAKEYRETIFDIGASGATTLTPNAANGNVQTISATGNFTLSAFTTPLTGQTITFIITQDATGSRTLTSTMKFAGGSKTLSTAANSIDILTVSYIGTTYYASLSKAFA